MLVHVQYTHDFHFEEKNNLQAKFTFFFLRQIFILIHLHVHWDLILT